MKALHYIMTCPRAGHTICHLIAYNRDDAMDMARAFARRRCIFSFTLSLVVNGGERVAANPEWVRIWL